jgi:hypothetical protein
MWYCRVGKGLPYCIKVLPESEKAPVLHGSNVEVWYSDQVHLGEGVRNAEEFLEELERLSGHVCKHRR